MNLNNIGSKFWSSPLIESKCNNVNFGRQLFRNINSTVIRIFSSTYQLFSVRLKRVKPKRRGILLALESQKSSVMWHSPHRCMIYTHSLQSSRHF
mmetsp:Transcript_17233/g.25644  ORF Transcript_17233/g.25644 Transcript_17233/m.25644 type:complete len:95 (-) Transcript_17233:19-303(-)